VQEALARLRARLGLDPGDAAQLHRGVVEAEVRRSMGRVREAWEQATYTKEALAKMNKERGRDIGDDPSVDGTGADLGFTDRPMLEDIRGAKLMHELTKVVDFYLDSNIFQDGEGIPSEERYPVTIGRSLDEKTKEDIYGIYAWNAITCQDATTQATWQAARPHVGGIFGLSEVAQKRLLLRMVSRWCDMFIKQKVEEKGALDEQDVLVLQTWVPTFFGIEEEVTQELVRSAHKGMLQAQALRLLNKPNVVLDDVQRLREAAAKWQLVLLRDLELTAPQLRALFQVEVEAVLVDEGRELGAKREAVQASGASFGVPVGEVSTALEGLLMRRCRGFLVNAIGDMMQGKEEQAWQEMRKIEQFAAFAAATDGVEIHSDDWEVSVLLRQRLVRSYADRAGADPAAVALLRRTLAVSVV